MSLPPLEDAPASRAALGAVLCCGALPLVPLAVLLARRVDPGRRELFVRWGFSHLMLCTAAFLVALGTLGRLAPPPVEASIVRSLFGSVLAFLAPALVTLAVARRTEPSAAASLGLVRPRTGRALLAGALVYLLLLPGVLGLGLLWPWVLERFGREPTAQDVLVQLLDLSGGALAAGLLLAVVVQPWLEELLFRAFLQPLLVQNLRASGGVALTSLVFASLHGEDAFLPVFGLSLLLGGVMLRTRSLPAVWAVHALHNGLTLAFFLLVPGARELLE